MIRSADSTYGQTLPSLKPMNDLMSAQVLAGRMRSTSS